MAERGHVAVVVWERWWTTDAVRTCERCRRLHGSLFRLGEGPRPPLHPQCRCQRRHDHFEVAESSGSGE